MDIKLGRKSKKDEKISLSKREKHERIDLWRSTIIKAKHLCKYIKTDTDRAWFYEAKIDEDFLLIVQYTTTPWTCGIELPYVKLQLTQRIEDKDVLVSQTFSSMLLGKWETNISGPRDRNLLDNEELDPILAYLALFKHYEEKKAEIEASPGYFFNHNLIKFRDIAENLDRINPCGGENLDIPLEKLVSLEERLKAIENSTELKGIKAYKAEREISTLYQEYHDKKIKEEKSKRSEEKSRLEEQIAIEREKAQTRVIPAEHDIPAEIEKPTKGYRKDINLDVKSRWEANYARILLLENLEFEYEPQTFELEVPKDMRSLFEGRETVKYTPDFFIKGTNKFIEIKGDWFAYGSHEAMAKVIIFKRLHPEYKLDIIGVAQYKTLERDYKDRINSDTRFSGWE
jgi:hypothetical protein